jgi:glycine/D-amino acid oxidase-like deaminating enzyme
MARRAEVAVIGAGIVGLSTARALKEDGRSVAIYEAAAPGSGQSAGESRLFRHAHDDVRLVEMAKRSLAAWRRWEGEFEIELISPDGAVALGGSALDRLEVMEQAGGLQAARIDGEEVARRLPLLASYDGTAIFDPEAGAIRTRAAVAALANSLGDSLHTDAGEVLSVAQDGPGVEIRAVGERASYDHVVVCAGHRTADLVESIAGKTPVQNSAHVRLEFRAHGAHAEVACIQDSSGAWDEEGIYGAPLPGKDRYAVGLSETTKRSADGRFNPAELERLAERTRAYVRRALPGLDPEPVGELHCWVTTLPWSDDAFAVWQEGAITWVIGHNLFKQAPALGEAIARSALDGNVEPGLSAEARLGTAQEG